LGYKAKDETLFGSSNAIKFKQEKYIGDTDSVDWTGILTTGVKDQGYCGSCWAVSATEQIETDSILAGLLNTTDTLSVQQIVSCDTSSNGVSASMVNYGCNGGNTETAYEYIESVGGLTTDALYPYTRLEQDYERFTVWV
jgi:C1A family cysteine protease